jgi:hypothetical protein
LTTTLGRDVDRVTGVRAAVARELSARGAEAPAVAVAPKAATIDRNADDERPTLRMRPAAAG